VPIKSAKEYKVSRYDLDVLIIECGPTNTRFCFSENGVEMPFIKRTFLALKDYEGIVVYFQHDIELPFPFGECLRNVSEDYVRSLSPINLTRMCWELGKEKLFFKNKRWIVLHHCLNEEFFLEYCSGARYRYKDYCEMGLIKPRYLYPLLISRYDLLELYLSPREYPAFDLMYVGREKDKLRTQLLLKFFDHREFSTCLIGEWEHKPWRYIIYLGVRGKQGDCTRYYNNAYATIFIPTEVMRRGGILTSRIYQALLGSCTTFIYHDIYGIEKLVSPKIRNFVLVRDREEFVEKVRLVKSLDVEDREYLVDLELKHLVKFYTSINWKTLFKW